MPITPLPRAQKKSSSPKRSMARPAVYPITSSATPVCHSCHALPAGSMEVAAILLVLVFSLSAVLFTSIYATRVQSAKVGALEAQLSSVQHN